MEKRKSQNYVLLLCIAVFAAALMIAALVGRITVTDVKYMTVSPDFSMLSVGEKLKCTAECASSTAVQLLILYAAGFSALSSKAAYVIAGYRGAAFGVVCSFIGKGSISLNRGEAYNIAGLIKIPEFLPPIMMHTASSVIVFTAAALSVSYSKAIMSDSCDEDVKNTGALRYTVLFLIFAGAAALIDAARLLFV